MSLVLDASTTSTVPPSAIRWTALTVRPKSAPGTGSCSFRISLPTPRSITLFGAAGTVTGWPAIRRVTVAVPVEPVQVLTDVALTADTSITGNPGTPMRALVTVEVAVDVSGARVVVTLAHNALTVSTRVEMLAVHGVVV